jgi:hypothetical protein
MKNAKLLVYTKYVVLTSVVVSGLLYLMINHFKDIPLI